LSIQLKIERRENPEEKINQLKTLVAEIVVLGQAAAVLTWDQQTNIPPGGAEVRANRLSYPVKLAWEKTISPEKGKLLEELSLCQPDQPGVGRGSLHQFFV